MLHKTKTIHKILILMFITITGFIVLRNDPVSSSKQKPLIIAHHAGGGQWPGNTIYAIQKVQENGIKIINVTTVLSKDKVPVLFHGFKLSSTTDGKGSPENFTVKQLQALDAGYQFNKNGKYIYRNKGIRIPTLKQTVNSINQDTKIIIDIKTPKYKALIDALQNTLEPKDWAKAIFYSTDGKALQYLKTLYPNATVFLDRETTRKILLNYKIQNSDIIQNIKTASLNWIAFENTRTMDICEKFTLGTSCTSETFKNLWTKNIIQDIHKYNPKAKIIMINANTVQDYKYATSLQMYGVYTNYPLQMTAGE